MLQENNITIEDRLWMELYRLNNTTMKDRLFLGLDLIYDTILFINLDKYAISSYLYYISIQSYLSQHIGNASS